MNIREIKELIINRINTIKNNIDQAKQQGEIQRYILLEEELREAEEILQKLNL